MAGLDSIWLVVANQAVYRANLGPILTPGFRPAPAILFYLVYLVGVVVLAVAPDREREQPSIGGCARRLSSASWPTRPTTSPTRRRSSSGA